MPSCVGTLGVLVRLPPSRLAYAVGLRGVHGRTHFREMKESRSNSLQKLDPGEFRGGAICDCFVYLLDFLLLLEADGPGSSYALAVSRLACGDALGLEDIQLVRIITTRVHAQ